VNIGTHPSIQVGDIEIQTAGGACLRLSVEADKQLGCAEPAS